MLSLSFAVEPIVGVASREDLPEMGRLRKGTADGRLWLH